MTVTDSRIFTTELHEVACTDPFATESGDAVVAELRELELQAAAFYGERTWRRRPRSGGVDMLNPATAALVARYPSVADWLSLVPSAAALDPLYAPTRTTFANGAPIDDGTRAFLDNIADAHGIRSRAAVMSRVLAAHARGGHAQAWLSLACGAAQPVVGAMASVREEGGAVPGVTLVDLDESALALARGYAQERGLEQHVRTVRANVLATAGLDGAALSTTGPDRPGPTGEFDVVDAVGLLEYLRPEDWSYSYRRVITSGRRLAGAVTFLRNAFSLVASGGVLVVGNMLDTHPQLGFTLDVVQWPHIQPRSVGEVLDLLDAAGVHGHVDVYLPSDGVYALYVVRKV